MARSLVTRILEGRVQESIASAASSILAGEAGTFDRYREMCGYIRGLSEAIKILDEIEMELLSERNHSGASH